MPFERHFEAAGVYLGMLDGQAGGCNTPVHVLVEVPLAYYILF